MKPRELWVEATLLDDLPHIHGVDAKLDREDAEASSYFLGRPLSYCEICLMGQAPLL